MKTESEGDNPPPSVGKSQEPGLEENPFRAYVGALPGFDTLEEINAWIRDIRDDDPAPDLRKD